MSLIEEEINKFLSRKISNPDNTRDASDDIKIFYRNQMSSNYKQVEENLKKIIQQNISSNEASRDINLIIYYKSNKVRNLFIKNNLHKVNKEKRSHVVYLYTCSQDECQLSSYIGYTECALVDRMRMHAQQGSILKHNSQRHQKKITTNEILHDTKILRHFNSKDDLTIAEALLIKEKNPSLNGQLEGSERVLLIF